MTVILRPAQNPNPSLNWLAHLSVCLPYSDVWNLKAPWCLLITIVIAATIAAASQGLS